MNWRHRIAFAVFAFGLLRSLGRGRREALRIVWAELRDSRLRAIELDL